MKRLEKPNWQKKERSKQFILLGVAGVALIGFVFVCGFYFWGDTLASETNVLAQGNRIFVNSGGDFQAALDKAKAGDTIMLKAGAEFKGSFLLPKKNGEAFITIRSSVADSKLPKSDTRIDPRKYASVLPKLSSRTNEPVIKTENGSHHYRFVGVEFGGTKNGENNIIEIGSTVEKKITDLPHHIEFDRVYIHATAKQGQRRGIAANGKNIVIKNSHIEGIRRMGDESQAIAVWATDGPIKIVNNYLEAAAENVLFGGAESFLQLVPTDCIVRDNHMNKPVEWKNENWVVKNLFEIKNGRRIKVENNLMTNNWAKGQDGTGVLFTVREDSGKAATIEDVEFINNIVRGSGNAVNILGEEGNGGRRLTIRNNLFADINKQTWGGGGHFMISSSWDGLIIENNTIIQNGNISNAYGKPIKNFIFRNNIIFNNEYGFIGDSVSPGKVTLAKFFPRAVIDKNIIVGGNDSDYGRKNYYPTSVRQIGFEDFENYKLLRNSPYRTKGANGKSVGAELDIGKVGRN